MKPSDFLTELSNEKLAKYKTAAAADASKADKEKDYARGNKRFTGIVKATNKQFANDTKKVEEAYSARGIMLAEARTYKLWENAGRKLMEAQLTADQIQQIFQQVEQGATAAGGNRTLLGKGKDAASAVKQAYDDLVSKVQNSGPVKGVDAMYDQAAEKLKQATGGDQGVMQYVQKYRDFAKKHPIAQSLIYSALIAAAGISGVGAGGAAALGLFKMVDKLLQGEKFSTAVGKGVTTGATAYAAGQIGQAMKGTPATPGADAATGARGDVGAYDQAAGSVYRGASGADPGAVIQGAQGAAQSAANSALSPAAQQISNAIDAGKPITQSSINALQSQLDKIGSMGSAAMSNPDGTASALGRQYSAYQDLLNKAVSAGAVKESVDLSESQIYLMIGKIVQRQNKIDEGIMDKVKGAVGNAVGKATDWAKTKGTNLTTKVTADKLLQAWKKAGSPTDSLDVANIIQQAGVPSDSIKQVYAGMKIPFAGEQGAGPAAGRNISPDSAPTAPAAASGASKPVAPSTTPKLAAAPTIAPDAEGGKNDQDKADARLAAAGMSPEQIAKERAKREARVAARSTQSATTPKPTSKPAIDPALNPIHNPALNPIHNPALNPTANPTLNPTANPRLNPIANPTTAATTASTAAPATANPATTAASSIGVKQINKLIPTLRKRDLLSVSKNVDAALAKKTTKVAAESMGLNYPETYEQTNDKFKSKGQRRVAALTNEEEKQRIDPKCWTGYKKQGTKMKGGTRVNNCVPVKESAILKGLRE